MTVSIFACEGYKAAMLVSDDPVYALGPVMVADSVEESTRLLEAFMGALERPADEMPTIQLMTEWQGFLIAFHGAMDEGAQRAVEQAQTEYDRGERENPPPAGGAAENGSESATGSEAEHILSEHQSDVAGAVGPQAPIPADEDEEEDDEGELSAEQLADRIRNVPGGTPAQRGEKDCWACGGEGTTPGVDGPVSCGVCEGTGKLAVEA